MAGGTVSARQNTRSRWLWVLVPLLSAGVASFVPPLSFALRHGRRSGYLWSTLLLSLTVAFFVVDPPQEQGARAGIAIALAMVCWLGGAVVTGGFVVTTREGDPVALARQQRRLRQRARRLVARDPKLAVQARIGRPDLRADSYDGGLVDVNRVPAEVLAGLPGIEPALAERIVCIRQQVGGFRSLADLVHVLNLNPADLDDAAELLAFVPR